MAAETVPVSQQSDGQLRIWFVPTGSNALSAAIINGGTSKALTYSLTSDGFNYGITQAEVEDKRLTLVQDLSQPGRKKETLEVKYVDSTDSASADVILTENLTGQLVIRRGISNATNAAVGDKIDVITFKAGAKRHDPPTENGVDTVTQTLYITAVTQTDATVVA